MIIDKTVVNNRKKGESIEFDVERETWKEFPQNRLIKIENKAIHWNTSSVPLDRSSRVK